MALRRPLVLTASLIAACKGQAPAPTAGPCERDATLELRVVDSNAPFMRELYAHVGAESAGGAATDPAAATAGIRAEIDQWQTAARGAEGRTHATDYYLFAPDRGALERYLRADAHPPGDRELRLERIQPAAGGEGWRTYYVHTSPMIQTRHVAAVEPASTPAAGAAMLRVVLTPEGTAAFAAGTRAMIGHKLAVVLDGVVVSAPIVEEAITGGQITIAMRPWQAPEVVLARLRCRR